MKSFLLLPLSVILSCSTVKNPDTQSTSQLLKDVEVLSSDRYEGRKTGTKGAEMARTYIADRFKELGVKSYAQNYAHPFTFQNQGQAAQNGINVLGYIPGKTDNVIVISAHYDHIGVINGEIYNGADDNASGVAALLEFAAYYTKNQPVHTLIFAAFDAEEVGLQGAKAFVAKPPVSLDKIVLNVNMDMISHNDKAELYVCGTFKYPELKKYIITSSPDIKVIPGHDDPKLGHDDWTNQSDHGAFNAKNIPFLYFGVEDHKDYHKESDEFKNINQSFFTNAANSIREIISNIDQDRDAQKRFKEKLKMK
ncbi:M28 family peptidase [Pedobacter faecalis]|uniref:M28 family peptidase n=1 Tax=Pedobacter faecalis TaxID=3041495 RepID=UPI00254CAF03|nr:M28 family peptidase [Pedobacter sp. ELA7]